MDANHLLYLSDPLGTTSHNYTKAKYWIALAGLCPGAVVSTVTIFQVMLVNLSSSLENLRTCQSDRFGVQYRTLLEGPLFCGTLPCPFVPLPVHVTKDGLLRESLESRGLVRVSRC